MRNLRAWSAFSLAALTAISCSDDHSHDDVGADCKAIIDACHEVDLGPGPIHDCHSNAEGTWSSDQCTANRERCVTLCANAGPNDAGSD